ncbi:MAG: hypothetical protein WC789_13830 [Lentisphaeria bacterium]
MREADKAIPSLLQRTRPDATGERYGRTPAGRPPVARPGAVDLSAVGYGKQWRYHFKGEGSETFTLDDTVDWRTLLLIGALRISQEGYAGLIDKTESRGMGKVGNGPWSELNFMIVAATTPNESCVASMYVNETSGDLEINLGGTDCWVHCAVYVIGSRGASTAYEEIGSGW